MEQKDIPLNSESLDAFLSKYFNYYNTLDKEWRSVFRTRVIGFIHSKWFVPQRGLEIDNRVKAIVSASAVQLTLGLKNWKIDYFDTIVLFPTDFTNIISGLKLKGETNLGGFVSFSWKSFIEGYRIPDDNLNLGLHEFTHALRFNGVRGHDSDEFFNGYFPKWLSHAKAEFNKLKNGSDSIFRKYGGANINEFLSVVVEHFFESPEEFKTELPLLYSATAILLNQKTDGVVTKVDIRK
jgi:MtfA peptidase